MILLPLLSPPAQAAPAVPVDLEQAKRLMQAAIAEGKADRRTPCLKLMAKAEVALEAVQDKTAESYWEEVERLGIMYREMSRPDAAIPIQERILEHRRKIYGLEHAEVADALNQLGVSHFQMRRMAQAETAWTQALAIREKVFGKHPLTADSLSNLGVLHRRAGQRSQAEQFLVRSRAIREETLGREHPAFGASTMNLGGLFAESGRLLEADDLFRQALQILEKKLGPKTLNIAKHLRSMALLNVQAGRLDEAQILLQRSLGIMEQHFKEDDEHGATCLAMATLQERRQDYASAVEWARKAVSLDARIRHPEHPLVGQARSNLGIYLHELNHHAEGLVELDAGLAILLKSGGPKHPDTLLCQYNRAIVLDALGRADEAGALYAAVLPAQEALHGSDFPRLALHWAEYGKNLLKRGKTPEAITAFQKSVDLEARTRDATLALLSDRERLRYGLPSENRAEALHALLCLAARGSVEGARAALPWFQWKGLALDAEDRVQASLLGPDQQECLKAVGQARRELGVLLLDGPGADGTAAFEARVAETRRRKEALEVELSRTSPAFRNLQSGQGITLPALAERLPGDAVLVDFARIPMLDPTSGRWGEPHYLALVIQGKTPGSVHVADLGPAHTIDTAIQSFRTEIERGAVSGGLRPGRTTSALQTLQSSLLAPLEGFLAPCTTLVLSPDGPLNLLPFEILAPTRGKMLLERFKVQYLAAPRDLLRQHPEIHAQGGVDIFTHPDFDGVVPVRKANPLRSSTAQSLRDLTFSPLPHSEKEGEAIRRVLKASGEVVRLHQGPEASEQALLACRTPRILHLATHGFFLGGNSDDTPMLSSGIALAGANASLKQRQDTGLLTAEKLTGLKLQGTDLVVLSACETGVGRVVDGEGVLGLKRALLLSGARNLVLSLWKVPDQATRALMVAFYRHLQTGTSKVEALRLAKLEVRKHFPHPLHWAAFVLVGPPQ